ncbi:MAG: DUF4097 family beta strand repeat protein [Lachnospiraceae bacterium]|nr:DUF4097 family beta strand repeat protein [Lachnospiraceae bacterium]
MWRKNYLRVLNTITVFCIIAGCIINGLRFFGGLAFNFIRSSSNAEVIGESGDLNSFSEIDADLSFGSLTIEYGDGYSYNYSGFTTETQPEFNVKGNKLEIRQKKNIDFNFFRDKAVDGKITLTVPESSEIDMDINLSMGSFNLNDINMGDLTLDADMGAITVKNCDMKDLNIQADMGGITFKDCSFKDGDFNANMGGITLKDCSFDTANCDADMGSIEVSGAFDTLTGDCDMGSIKAENSNENAKYDLDCDMGSIKINGQNKGDKYKN